jgi:hypothetical protein
MYESLYDHDYNLRERETNKNKIHIEKNKVSLFWENRRLMYH